MPSLKPPPDSPVRSSRAAQKSGGPVTWVRDLLKRPLKVERRGAQLHLVLGERPPEPAPVESVPTAGEALRRGHEELRALLRRHPEIRHLMRHLGFIEQQLGRSNSRALKRDIPVPMLRKGLEQLDLLMRGETSEPLADLRARIETAARSRSGAVEARAEEVQVSEASHSLFDEMERSWTGQMPLSETKSDDSR